LENRGLTPILLYILPQEVYQKLTDSQKAGVDFQPFAADAVMVVFSAGELSEVALARAGIRVTTVEIGEAIARMMRDQSGAVDLDVALEGPLLRAARAARDALVDVVKRSKPAAVTGGYNIETGEVAARTNTHGECCAEKNVENALGGDKSVIRFTEARRPRTGKEQPICPGCEAEYGRDAFPPGTRFESDEAPK
jgi:hypothetical protein